MSNSRIAMVIIVIIIGFVVIQLKTNADTGNTQPVRKLGPL